MINKKDKNANRRKIHGRIRNKIVGTTERPRLCVYRSLNNISAQIIDDTKGTTLCSASTLDKEVKAKGANIASATEVGKLIAERAKKAKIETVVFDRGGYVYTGKVKALADSAREAGLKF